MLTLYSVPTANGQRASIALEEAGLEYEVVPVDLLSGEHRSPEMLELNPFGRMPVLSVPAGRTEPMNVYGSLAIATYAAEQSGRLIPERSADRTEMHRWVGVIMTDLAPAFAAQFYLGVLAPEPDEWAVGHYREIIERFLGGIDRHLAGRDCFVGGDVTLADLLMYPTAASSVSRLEGGLARWPGIARWAAAIGSREAVERGMRACPGSVPGSDPGSD